MFFKSSKTIIIFLLLISILMTGCSAGQSTEESSNGNEVKLVLAAYTTPREAYGEIIPRPSWWGGYRVIPAEFEFWQGRPSRLHDRLRYQREASGWRRDRLAP